MHPIVFLKANLLLIYTFILLIGTVGAQNKPDQELVVSKCWTYSIESGRSIAADSTRVYLSTTDAKVESLSLDGKKLWATELGGDTASNIAVDDLGVYLVTISPANGEKQATASLRALSKDTGITGWNIKIGDSVDQTLASSSAGLVVVSGSGIVQSIDPKTGSIRWKRELATAFSGEPYISGDKLMVASKSNQLFGVSLLTGEIGFMRKLSVDITTAGGTSGGDALAGDAYGNVTLLREGDGKAIWNYKSGGAIAEVRVVNGHALVTSNDNFAYYLRLQNGGLAWKRRFAGRVTRVGLQDTTIALISSLEEHGATFINLSSGKSIGQIAFEADEFMEADPVFVNGLILVLTNSRLAAYSLGACSLSR